MQRQERKVLGLPLTGADDGIDRVALFQHLPGTPDGIAEPVFLVVCKGFRPAGLSLSGIVCPLPHQNRRNALESLQQRLGKFSRFRGKHRQHLLRGRLQKVEPFVSRRHFVCQPRQHQTLAGHGGVHSFHAVDDLSGLIDENEVGIAPHDLHGKGQLHNIPQLVDTGEVEIQHTFQPVLPDIQELAVSQPFPQEHTEHGRRFRIFDSDLGEVNSRPVCRTGEQHLCTAGAAAKGNDQFFPCGLVNFFNACVDQRQKFLSHCV